MNILSKLGLVKNKQEEEIVPFQKLLEFMAFKWNELVPKNDFKFIGRQGGVYSGSSTNVYLLNNRFLFECYEGHHYPDKDGYFPNNNVYVGNYFWGITIYIVDDTFDSEKYFKTYEYMKCFPRIKSEHGILIEGTWIEDLKSYIKSIKINDYYLIHKSEIDEVNRKWELEVEREKQCCNKKRDNILNNYGK